MKDKQLFTGMNVQEPNHPSDRKRNQQLAQTIDRLSDGESLYGLFLDSNAPLPSASILKDFVETCRAVIFPGYYGKTVACKQMLPYHIGVNVEHLFDLLCKALHDERKALAFIEKLPSLRTILATDVEAAYKGDPAAESYSEVISCYPAIKAVSNYRIAHELLLLGVPLIPRFITEMAHSETGIDIHPAATIGSHFTIDHGTGVVIGATCIIGNNVKLYQGVTLGAKSFPLDDDGNPIKGVPRHPIIEDDVIIYSNATVLGRITIAKGTVIGGNVWVTESTRPGERILQRKTKEQ